MSGYKLKILVPPTEFDTRMKVALMARRTLFGYPVGWEQVTEAWFYNDDSDEKIEKELIELYEMRLPLEREKSDKWL